MFTSDAKYDGLTYGIDVVCDSMLATQEPIVQTFGITFEHDASASDATTYSQCANDFIFWNSDLTDFELAVSAIPQDVSFRPLIRQQVAGCPILC